MIVNMTENLIINRALSRTVCIIVNKYMFASIAP